MADCFVWNVDPVIWHGPIDIRWYGVMFIFVFLTGWAFLRWQIKRGGHDEQLAYDFVFWAMVAVIVGGWLGHQVFYRWDRILIDPASMFRFRGGIRGLSSHGSTIGLVVALVLFGRKHKIPMLEMIDRFAISATCGATLVRIGNFFNSEILGRPAEVAWAVCFARKDSPLVPRHPSQLYEAGLGLLVMGALVLVDRWAGKEKRPAGILAGSFFMLYFALRFFVEFFKAHQTLSSQSTLTMGQYLSIPMFLLGLALVVNALKWGTPTDQLHPEPAPAPRTPAKKKKAKGKKKKRK